MCRQVKAKCLHGTDSVCLHSIQQCLFLLSDCKGTNFFLFVKMFFIRANSSSSLNACIYKDFENVERNPLVRLNKLCIF